jgi:hypothetical protein
MLESENPYIDIADLLERVQAEVARVYHSRASDIAEERVLTLRGSVNLGAIESWVTIADQRSRIRTKWPSHLRFALSSSRRLQGVALKVLAFLFKDQRHVNEALIAAFRESITLNRHLIEQLELLRERIEALERR